MIRRPPRSTLFPTRRSSDLAHFDLCQQDCSWPAPKLDADRKSTRLNSSHGYISYAVFCLKKKKNENQVVAPPINTFIIDMCVIVTARCDQHQIGLQC